MTAREGLSNAIRASEILDVDEELRSRLIEARDAMAPLQIGEAGHLPEWRIGQSFDCRDTPGACAPDNSPDVDFRHMTHLYAFHPAAQITTRGTPALAEALRVSLTRRKPAGRTSFMAGRKANAWARFEDGEQAWEWIRTMIDWYAFDSLGMGHDPGPRSVHYEGNGSWSSGVAEMLVQSHDGAIFLLPALPEAWSDGSVQGLRSRGGFVVESLRWEGGRLSRATIRSTVGGVCRIRTQEAVEALGIAFHSPSGESANPLFARSLWGDPDDHSASDSEPPPRPALHEIEFDTTPGQLIELR